MKSCLLLAIVLVLPIEAPSAAEPDAPVVATPTLATEIKRGMDAESACSETIDPPGYARCIFAIEARNQQMMMSNKPFDTDRKSTRLNCSHLVISYAVFCLK